MSGSDVRLDGQASDGRGDGGRAGDGHFRTRGSGGGQRSVSRFVLLTVLVSGAVSLMARPGIRLVQPWRTPLGGEVMTLALFLLLLTLALLLRYCVSGMAAGVLNGMPIVVKELLEQAARRRTWWLRSVYALLAFFAAFSLTASTLAANWSGNLFQTLGQGRKLFELFTVVQFFGIYLFLPAMVCPLLTSEKERDTLALLFLTRLSPWGILAGKLLSRLVPMFLLLSLSLPLSAFAYSLGGFEQSLIWMTIWVLCLTVVQVAALGLLCSAFFRTTVGAFIATYLLGFLMLFGPVIFDEATGGLRALHRGLQAVFGTQTVLGFETYRFAAMFFAPAIEPSLSSGLSFTSGAQDVLLRSVPILVLSAVLLLLARVFLVRRAFVARRNLLLAGFRKLDRVFWQLNDQFGRGIVLAGGTESLPGAQPVAWRETTKKTLGTTRYLVRIFLGLEFPVLLICALSVIVGGSGWNEMLSMLLFIIWIVATLLICVQSASLFAGERTHQTLDVLLTTPLTNQELFLQKLRGVLRLALVTAVPLLTVYGFAAWLYCDAQGWGGFRSRPYSWQNQSGILPALCYLLSGVVTIVIYFPMIAAVGVLAGLVLRSQARAIIAGLGVLTGWCLLPLLVISLLLGVVFNAPWRGFVEYVMLATPAAMIGMNEGHEFSLPWIALLLNSVWHGAVTVVLWTVCLTRLSHLLRRSDSPEAVRNTRPVHPGLPPPVPASA